MPSGRPTNYTKELADDICGLLSDGQSLRKVCRSDDFPCKATVFNWLRTNEAFLDQYTRAKEESADSHVDDIVDDVQNIGIAAVDDEGKLILIDGKPVMIIDAVAINHARLIMDAKKWAAIKLRPKKYGDKLDLTTGGDKITFNSNY